MSLITEIIKIISAPAFFSVEIEDESKLNGKQEISNKHSNNFILDFFSLYQKYPDQCGDINDCDDQGRTLLHCIARHGSANELQVLLTFKPKLDSKDNQGATAFHYVMQTHNDYPAKFNLLSNASSEETKKGVSPWFFYTDNSMRPPIFYAIEAGKTETINFFLKSESDKVHGLIDCFGCNAVFIAVLQEKIEIVKLLLQYGGNPYIETTKNDPKNKFVRQDNAITLAIRNGYKDLSEFFVNGGYAIGLNLPEEINSTTFNFDYAMVIGATIAGKAIKQEGSFALAILTTEMLRNFLTSLLAIKREYDVSQNQRNQQSQDYSELVLKIQKLLRFAYYMADGKFPELKEVMSLEKASWQEFSIKLTSLKNLSTIFSIHHNVKEKFQRLLSLNVQVEQSAMNEIEKFTMKFSGKLFDLATYALIYGDIRIKKQILANPSKYLLKKYNNHLPELLIIFLEKKLQDEKFPDDETLKEVIKNIELLNQRNEMMHLFALAKTILNSSSSLLWERIAELFIVPTSLYSQMSGMDSSKINNRGEETENVFLEDEKNYQQGVFERTHTINVLTNWQMELENFIQELQIYLDKYNKRDANICFAIMTLIVIIGFSQFFLFFVGSIVSTYCNPLNYDNSTFEPLNNDTILPINNITTNLLNLCIPIKKSDWLGAIISGGVFFIPQLILVLLCVYRFDFCRNDTTPKYAERRKVNHHEAFFLKVRNLQGLATLKDFDELDMGGKTFADFRQQISDEKITFREFKELLNNFKNFLDTLKKDLNSASTYSGREDDDYRKKIKAINLSGFKNKGIFDLGVKRVVVEMNELVAPIDYDENSPLLINGKYVKQYS